MKSSNKSQIQQAFTQQAAVFESERMNFSKQDYLDSVVQKIVPSKTDTVLEVAAGTCACGRTIAPYTGNVVCLDMTPAMLSVGKAKAEKNHLGNMTFCETTKMPVVLQSWLEHTKTPPEIQNQIKNKMLDKINSGDKTGFAPYTHDGKICFNQRWILMIGKNRGHTWQIDVVALP